MLRWLQPLINVTGPRRKVQNWALPCLPTTAREIRERIDSVMAQEDELSELNVSFLCDPLFSSKRFTSFLWSYDENEMREPRQCCYNRAWYVVACSSNLTNAGSSSLPLESKLDGGRTTEIALWVKVLPPCIHHVYTHTPCIHVRVINKKKR